MAESKFVHGVLAGKDTGCHFCGGKIKVGEKAVTFTTKINRPWDYIDGDWLMPSRSFTSVYCSGCFKEFGKEETSHAEDNGRESRKS